MNRYTTQGIVLNRTDYGEAARIITFLTPDRGKLRVMAKGVRKPKSKLAGGIELFSVSDLTLLAGRGEIQTLMSARLAQHYGRIVKDLDRTQAGYDIIKLINKSTEDEPEEAYFNLLVLSFESLNDSKLEPVITALWANIQLLKMSGHTPDMQNDITGAKLSPAKSYDFHLEDMRFAPKNSQLGSFNANHIKFLRVSIAAASPRILQRVEGSSQMAQKLQPLVQSMLKTFFRV